MINRRSLLGGLAIAATTTSFLVRPTPAASTPTQRKPARLQPGDSVGIFSPAGATFRRTDLDVVQDAVRGLGLVPVVAPHALERYGYLAGSDRDRADDVNELFANPAIAALLPIRGDWGCARILPYLDYELIRENPKIVVGFSDLTALTLGIYAQTGLVTFHGPNGLAAWRSDQVEAFRSILFNGEARRFENPLLGEDQSRLMRVSGRVQTITPGRTRGRLVGGNLSVLSGIVGSPYLPDLNGAILFLEDVAEPPYRVDRMLTQLKLAGALEGLAGFVFGQCTRCNPGSDYGSLTLEEILNDHIQPLGIPAWSGAWIGHVEPMWTLPIGVEVAIDATAGTIQMLEGAIA